MKRRIAPAVLLALLAAGASTAAGGESARTAGSGGWIQITHSHSGAKPNLGLARGRDGTLHVFWAGPNRAPFPTIFDTPVSASGAFGRAKPVLSGWSAVHPPAAVTAPDGSIHVVVSGAKVGTTADPLSGLNELVGPGAWKLGPKAFGNSSITEASNADVRTAVLRNGQLVSVWLSAATTLFQAGTDPATVPQRLTPTGTGPAVAVDQRTGEAVIAYQRVDNGADEFRRVLPSLGPPQVFPGVKIDAPQLAARAGGGIYTAYTPDHTRVWLFRYGRRPSSVPVPKGAAVFTAGLAPGPEGRLWLFYGNDQHTYVTRTNRAVSRFEPVQTFTSPKAAQYFRLEGEGSAAALDLFVDLTVDGVSKDGSYGRHVPALFSLAVSKTPVKNRRGTVTGVRVTVRVLDAGDGVAGATVKGLPGGTKTTNARGSIVLTLPAARKGSFRLLATKAGYLSANGTLTL